ncbi:MAG: hypothetical protein LAO05_15750 [Acidobacteriia bacterium]|nr:hypothetical protein [Terriglobia bacterium]
MNPEFSGSDSWVLLATGLAARNRGARLAEVIAAGDAVNHAIFTLAELRRGFAKLIAAGYLRVEGGRFYLIESAREAVDQATKRGFARGFEPIGRFLGVQSRSWDPPTFEDPRWRFPDLSEEAYSAAVGEYTAEPQRVLDGM